METKKVRLFFAVLSLVIALSVFLVVPNHAFANSTPGCAPSNQAVTFGTATVGQFSVTCTQVDRGFWFIHDYVAFVHIKLTLLSPWKMKQPSAPNSELESTYAEEFQAGSKDGELWILKKDLSSVNYQSGFDVYTSGRIIVRPIIGCQPDMLGISPCDS